MDVFSTASAPILDGAGRSYQEFRRSLKPHYGIVWRDIALAWALIAALQIVVITSAITAPAMSVLVVLVASVFSGFFLANLILFVHEAAHFNIHPDKTWNDRLCNVFLSGVIGVDVADYRIVHWRHHRTLGTPEDSERSYFDAVTLRYIVESLLMIRVLKVLVRRQEVTSEAPTTAQSGQRKLGMALGALLANGAYLAVLFWLGEYLAIACWILTILVFYPFFSAIRQVLEHRSLEARDEVDYSLEPHGETNRMFRRNLFSFFFGGAGFNRHLLHHFDPSISYTNLPEVERFLADTELADSITQSYTTYGQVFSQLFRWKTAQ